MAGKGVRELIRHSLMTGRGGKKGPWRVEMEPEFGFGYLIHYGTRMLKWRILADGVEILETWTGHGSVSDQTGVNAALDALGSRLHYYRDARGGGPRINPFHVGSIVGSLRSISPAQYNPVIPPQYNSRRTRRRR